MIVSLSTTISKVNETSLVELTSENLKNFDFH